MTNDRRQRTDVRLQISDVRKQMTVGEKQIIDDRYRKSELIAIGF